MWFDINKGSMFSIPEKNKKHTLELLNKLICFSSNSNFKMISWSCDRKITSSVGIRPPCSFSLESQTGGSAVATGGVSRNISVDSGRDQRRPLRDKHRNYVQPGAKTFVGKVCADVHQINREINQVLFCCDQYLASSVGEKLRSLFNNNNNKNSYPVVFFWSMSGLK